MSDDGGYRLPLEIDPPRICVTVQVPDDPQHRAAFVGQLIDLGRWYTWERDQAHTAREVAAVWDEIARLVIAQLDIGGHNCIGEIVDVRQNPENPCLLEKTYDGLTWETFANLQLCGPVLRRNPATGHYEASDDGGITFYEVPDGPWVENAGPYVPPPPPRTEPTEDERKCAAAANATEVLRLTYRDIGTSLAAPENGSNDILLEAIDVIGGLLGFNGSLLTWGSAALAIFGFRAAYSGEPWDETVADEVRCSLYNRADASSEVVTFDFDGFKSDMADLYTSTDNGAYGLINLMMAFLDAAGLNLAGSTTSITDPDCSDCTASCFDGPIDYTASQGSSYPEVGGGVYTPGVGWQQEIVDDHMQMLVYQPCEEPGFASQFKVHVAAGYNTGGVNALFVRFMRDGAMVWESGGEGINEGWAPVWWTFTTPTNIEFDTVGWYQRNNGTDPARRVTIDAIELVPV